MTLNRVKQVPREERGAVRVSDVACPVDEIPTASPDEPLVALLPRMTGCSDGRALVLEDGRVVGIVSPTDVARRIELTDLRSSALRDHT